MCVWECIPCQLRFIMTFLVQPNRMWCKYAIHRQVGRSWLSQLVQILNTLSSQEVGEITLNDLVILRQKSSLLAPALTRFDCLFHIYVYHCHLILFLPTVPFSLLLYVVLYEHKIGGKLQHKIDL